MNGLLVLDRKGKIESTRSAYQPSEDVRELTVLVKNKFSDGEMVQSEPQKAYNGKSFITQADDAQRTWLSHPDAPYVGDDEWRWNGVRPITRNRVIAVAARLTAQLLYPKQYAQNSDQEEDRNAAYAMDALVEYNIRHSNYETAFLFGVIAGLVGPINYFQVDYCQSYQDAWIQGKRERVVDDIFSGFQNSLIPADEMLFGNAHLYEWQKQDWIIRKRRKSYEEMESKHGLHENWAHVKRGVITMIADDGHFYDVSDINDDLVGEVCFKHRRSDAELYFVNGIYLSNPNTEYNPFYHRTPKDQPRYNEVKFGFEPIDAMRFIGYKSLVDKMSNDQNAADRQWQDAFDASRLATFPPLITMGAGRIDKSVVAPSNVQELGAKAKAVPLNIADPSAAFAALHEAERSATETSVDPQTQGVQQGPSKTKGEVVQLQENTDTNLGLTAKMIARMVKEVGELIVHDIVRYQTIGEVGEIIGEMNYKTFVVDGRVKEGKHVSTYVKFTHRFAGKSMSKEEREMEEYRMLTEAGDDKEILEVNPGVFSQLEFFTVTDAEKLMSRNDAFERAFKVSAYEKAVADSLVQADPEAHGKILRDFLFEPLMRGEASKYMPNIQKIAQQMTGMDPNNPEQKPGYPQSDIPGKVVAASAMRRMV